MLAKAVHAEFRALSAEVIAVTGCLCESSISTKQQQTVVSYTYADRPEMTRFLNEGERKIAISRMNRSISGDVGLVVNKGMLPFTITL